VTPRNSAVPTGTLVVPDVLEPLLEDLAHELKSPIKAIRLVAEAIQDSAESLPPQQLHRLIGSILRSTRFMGDLVERLTLERGGEPPALRRLRADLGSLLLETIEDMVGILGGRRLRLTISAGARIHLDPVRIRQVLVNLLSNAARFSPPGSTVSVALGPHPGGIAISVADECSGIRPIDLGRIFQRGQRAPGGPGGSGLGLSLARAIARSHGGDLTVRSGAAGGCRFTLTLPGRPLSVVS
jgi:signal transduction histidine kinase